MRTRLLLFILLLPLAAQAQTTTFTPNCAGSNDTAKFSALISAIGSNTATIRLPYKSGSRCAINTLTIPSNITLDNTDGTGIKINSGQVLTVVGPVVSTPKLLFSNATAGLGTVSFSGNHAMSIIYPEWFGAKADGSTDCAASIQAAQTALTTLGGGAGGSVLYFSAGTYNVSAAIVLLQVKGIRWQGAGRINCIINSTTPTPIIQGNGVWYSRFEGLRFTQSVATTNQGMIELDGNYDSVHTQGVQANTFIDCLFAGHANSTYTFTINRQGGGAAQGDHCEFYNCHFSGSSSRCFWQNGSNVLNTLFIGGDFQGYQKTGIHLTGGSVNVYGTSFESTYGYTQVLNGGVDIDASSTGVYDEIVISGVRTESLAFYKGGSAQNGYISGFNYTPASNAAWSALTPYTLNSVSYKTAPNGSINLYRVTTAGTSGGTEPVWPNSGTIADGSITWTLTSFDVITLFNGSLKDYTGYVGISRTGVVQNFPSYNMNLTGTVEVSPAPARLVTTSTLLSVLDQDVLVDTTAGNTTITVPAIVRRTQHLNIKKYTTDANTVIVTSLGNAIDLTGNYTIAGGSRGYVQLKGIGGGPFSDAYFIVAHS